MTNTMEASLQSKKNLFEFKSIKTKLTIIIVVMLIVAGTALTGIAAYMAAEALRSSTIGTINAIGVSTAEKLEIVNAAGEDTATVLSLDPQVISAMSSWNEGTLTPEEQLSVIGHINEITGRSSDIFGRINILDNQGIVVISSEPTNIGIDNSQSQYFTHQQREAYTAGPYLGAGNNPYFAYARPVYDDNGQQIGLVQVGMSIPGLDDLVFSKPGLSADATNFLVSPDGTILSGVQGDYSPFLTKKFDLSIFSAGETMVQALGYFGRPAFIVKTPVSNTNWSVITTERVEKVNIPIMALVTMMIVFLLVVIATGAFVAFFISTNFARPIQALTDSAEQLALGDVDVAITHTGIDEIGQLAEAFRNMVEKTKERANYISGIAAGDISSRMAAASDRDVEGLALIQMKKTISYMVKSLNTLANRADEGDMSYRADAAKFKGVYREMMETLNHAFDLIANPLQEAMRLSTSYSSGDYSDRFDPDMLVKGDFISFKAALNQIGINSSDTLLKVRNGVHEVSAGASQSASNVEEIAGAVSTLAESSSRVSSLADHNEAGLDQALTAMSDLADTVSEVAGRTTVVSELASRSSDLAYDGVKQAEVAGNGMEGIMKSFVEISTSVSDMSSQMDEIGGIVDVISGIAEQTSLLALNAAIEAARAGDAGLGFAVVADEVKSLAQESQTSAEHISSIIDNLHKMSVEMTTGMESATDVMQSGNNAVRETITIFHQMAEAITDVSRNMSEVAAASEEQAASVQEITASISEVRDMVQDTAKEALSVATTAKEINASLDQMKEISAESAQLADTIAGQVNMFKIE